MNALALLNESSFVSDAECEIMAKAVSLSLVDFCSGWGLERCEMTFYPSKQAPDGVPIFRIIDDEPSTPDGVLGYHSEQPDGRIYSDIEAKPCLASGSTAFAGDTSVASCLAHEVFEMLVDPHCNEWVDGLVSDEGSCYAKEVVDPVESDGYPVAVVDANGNVHMVVISNWVLPEWFDMATREGKKVDFMGTSPGPFRLAHGGYYMVRQEPGTEREVFGKYGARPPSLHRLNAKAGRKRSRSRLRGARWIGGRP